MRITSLGVLAVLVSCVLSGSAGAEPSTPPSFPSQVELITVDAVVVDDDGRPMAGLTRDDFVVKEDGREQPLASFEAFVVDGATAGAATSPASAPAVSGGRRKSSGRTYAVVVDDLALSLREIKIAREGLAAFVEKGLREGDEVILVTTSGDASWSARMPEGRADLLAVLGRLKGRDMDPLIATDYMTDYEAYVLSGIERHAVGRITQRVVERWIRSGACTSGPGRKYDPACEPMAQHRAEAQYARRRGQVRDTLSVLRRTTDAMAGVRGRKSMLFVSKGFVDDPDLPLRDLIAASREANTAVYFLDARGLMANMASGLPSASDAFGAPNPNDVSGMGFEAMVLDSGGAQDLARDTGGLTIRNSNDIGQGAARIAEQSRVFYLLGFYPPEGKKPGDWRKLKVEVKRRGLKVHARRGYTVRKAAPATDGKSTSPLVARALESVQDESAIPLRARAYVLEPTESGKTHVLVAAEIDARQLAFQGPPEARVATLELSVQASHRDTGRSLQASQKVQVRLAPGQEPGWRAVVQDLNLPAGVAQVRVVARDVTTDALGAASHRFEVPPADGLRLSTPIVTDQLADTTSAEETLAPALAVHRTFRPEGLLYCQFEVFGAATNPGEVQPRVAMGVEVRTRDGRLVRATAPTRVVPDANGRLVRLVGVGLDGIADGTYDLVLQVKDEVSGSTVEQRETFELDSQNGNVAS
jgi:VWFA-related protein